MRDFNVPNALVEVFSLYCPEDSKALAELKRRQKTEERRDKWLKADLRRFLTHDVDVGGHTVRLYCNRSDFKDGWHVGAGFQFKDYWSACDWALDQAERVT
jgi:hypothetical protein